MILQNDAPKGAGGGIYSSGGTVEMNGGQITGNKAATGGGAYVSQAAASIKGDAIVSNNSASNGGGYFAGGSSRSTVAQSKFSGNTATASEGAIYKYSGSLRVEKYSELVGNRARFGGALYNRSHTATMTTTKISQNEATASGGAIDLRLRSDAAAAINQGSNDAVYYVDIDDFDLAKGDRFFDETIDIGAYEYQGGRDDAPYKTVVDTLDDVVDLNDDK